MIKLKDLLNEYRIRGNADSLVIGKGDIKKGMMVWFEDGKGRAKKLKVKHVILSKDKKEDSGFNIAGVDEEVDRIVNLANYS